MPHIGVVDDVGSDWGMADGPRIGRMFIFPHFVKKIKNKEHVECITFDNEVLKTFSGENYPIVKLRYGRGEVFRLKNDHHGKPLPIPKDHLTVEDMDLLVDHRIDVIRKSASLGDLIGYSPYTWLQTPVWIIAIAVVVTSICWLISTFS